MTDPIAVRAQAITEAAGAVKGLSAEEHQTLNAVISPPGASTKNLIWVILISGLVALLVISLGGLVYLLAEGKTTDVLLTAFTALLTGLIGLFSPSPSTNAG